MRAVLAVLAATVFTQCESGPVPTGCCEPGDRLDVIMVPGGDPAARCDDMGGEFNLAGLTCIGVDF